MKFLVLSLCFLTAGLSHAATQARCLLSKSLFSTQNYREYVLEDSRTVGTYSMPLVNGQAQIQGLYEAVTYHVQFDLNREYIAGQMTLNSDQPSAIDQGETYHKLYLNLMLEELFNGGKEVYALHCQIE